MELIFHSLAAVWNPHNSNKAPSSLFSYSVYSKYPLLFPTGQNSPGASHFIDWSISPNLTTATSSTCLLDHNNASLCLHCIYLSLSCVSSRSLHSALYCKYWRCSSPSYLKWTPFQVHVLKALVIICLCLCPSLCFHHGEFGVTVEVQSGHI